MRVCQLHRDDAVMTLKDMREGTEYDLCPKCKELLTAILEGENGPKRAGRPLKNAVK